MRLLTVVDRILNHVSGSTKGVAAVYQRGQYLNKRRAILDAWAEYLASDTHFVFSITSLRK